MGARRTSRLIASAVAVATFSSITVVPSAVAADHTTFVEEKTTDDTGSLNGIEFDEDGNLLEENNAGDKAMEELDAKDAAESITPYAVDGAEETAGAPASEESAKPSTLEELAQTEASNGDVNVKVVKDEQKDKFVCEVTDVPEKEVNMLDLKLALAKAFYDGGEKILKTV